MEHSRKLALIIGVDHYIYFPEITLSYTRKDAFSISEILKKRGFDKVVELHEDVEEQMYTPIRGNILERMEEICREAGSDDLLFVYFSGHGHREKENGDELLGKPLLLPSDLSYQRKPVKRGKKEDIIRYEKKIIEDTAIPIADVIRQMNSSPARQKILIIDACFAGIDLDNLAADLGQLFREATGSSPNPNGDSRKVADEGKNRYGGYALFYEAEGFAMLAASTGSQVSRESVALKHGYFTYHLLNGLKGAALRDNKPFITVTDIALYTAQQLRNMSWGAGFQEPTSLMAMKGDMILVESQDFIPNYRPLIVPRRMVFRYNARFVSREKALDSLKGAFVDSQGEKTKVAVATGMGGIGKTQVAGQFIYEHERDFPGGVFWLNFAKSEQIKSEIADCGSNMYMNLKGFDESDIEKSYGLVVAEWNRKDAPRRLLIFDNCEDPKLLATYLPNPDSNCCVLVTSRRRRWSKTQGLQDKEIVDFPIESLADLGLNEEQKRRLAAFSKNLLLLPLGELTEDDSLELLYKFREFSKDKDDAVHLKEIAKRVGYLPLALHLSGSVLSTFKTAKGLIDPAEYAKKLTVDPLISEFVKQLADITRSQDGTPSGDEPDLPTHHAHVLPTFVMSYEQLKHKDEDKPEELACKILSRKFLLRAAFFKPNEPISANLLIQSLPNFPPAPREDEESSKKQEQQQKHDEFVKVAKDALERLVNLGLLDWSGRFDVEGYVIHPLVALFVQTIKNALINEAERREAEAKKAEKGYEELTKEAAELRKEAEQLPSELETAQTDVERAMYEAARDLGEKEDLLETMKIQAHLRHIVDAAMKREQKSEWAVGLCAEISIYLYMVGDSKGAEPYFAHAEKFCDERIEQNDSSDYIVGIADGLALVLREYNVNLKKSCKYQRYAVDKCPDNNMYRSCLANVLGRMGEYGEALKLVEEVLKDLESKNHDLHGNLDLREAYNSLSLIKYWKGDYHGAFEIIKRLKEVLFLEEKTNYDTELLAVARNLARVAMMIGGKNYDIAQEMLDKAQVIQKDIHGDGAKNRNIAMFYHLRGKILRLQERIEDFDSAKEDLIRAYEMNVELVQILDAATDLNELSLLLKEMKGELPQARVYAEQALNIREAELGLDHPLVAESLYALAAILHKHGSLVDARRLAERALNTCLKKGLVEEHYVVKALRELLAALGS